MPNIKLLHISAHLGGGVGRVLSKVACFRHKTQQPIHETFLCIEEPKDKKNVEILNETGSDIILSPTVDEAKQLILSADIVQIEWWHHPLMAGFLSDIACFDARLVIWSHISGTSYPFIPDKFLTFPDLFLFTSPVSKICIDSIHENEKKNTAVVHSSGGFDDFPIVERPTKYRRTIKCGYVGTYNFAKLHPQIVQYLEAANHINFSMDFYGDLEAADGLRGQIEMSDSCNERVRLNGYIEKPSSVLAEFDLFIYLLNPLHYGTTENALLEAMACGVVPIVMNNPVERTIVTHKETGFLVNNLSEFVAALEFCASHSDEILQMSQKCCKEIRKRFSLKITEESLRKHYLELIGHPKQQYDFRLLFGNTPEEWFYFALGDCAPCFQPGSQESAEWRLKRLSYPIFYEKTKS